MKTILAAGGFALLLSLFGTPLLIRGLVKKGYARSFAMMVRLLTTLSAEDPQWVESSSSSLPSLHI